MESARLDPADPLRLIAPCSINGEQAVLPVQVVDAPMYDCKACISFR